MNMHSRKQAIFGFTLIELLISLAIMGVLLAALATAFSASMTNYQENEKLFRNINAARQALIRMTSQIRTGFVDPNSIANEQVCTIECDDGSNVRYYYDGENKKLCLELDGTSYTLCENVAAVSFKKQLSTGPYPDVKSVRISITLQEGDYEQNLAAAAVVRKVLNR